MQPSAPEIEYTTIPANQIKEGDVLSLQGRSYFVTVAKVEYNPEYKCIDVFNEDSDWVGEFDKDEPVKKVIRFKSDTHEWKV